MIKKDVVRTMQEVPMFREKELQSRTEEILLVWSQENPEFNYQ